MGRYSALVQIQVPQVVRTAIEISTHGQPTVNQVKPTPTVMAAIAAILARLPIARRSRQSRSEGP